MSEKLLVVPGLALKDRRWLDQSLRELQRTGVLHEEVKLDHIVSNNEQYKLRRDTPEARGMFVVLRSLKPRLEKSSGLLVVNGEDEAIGLTNGATGRATMSRSIGGVASKLMVWAASIYNDGSARERNVFISHDFPRVSGVTPLTARNGGVLYAHERATEVKYAFPIVVGQNRGLIASDMQARQQIMGGQR